MSERERWIIYPLLFFALGAAVRDKIIHRVDTKEVYCESLKIVDQQDPLGQTFVELSIQRKNSPDPKQPDQPYGMLRLFDGKGQEVCQMDSNSLQLVNQQKDGKQSFVELTIQRKKSPDPSKPDVQSGHLRLVDSAGEKICQLDSTSLKIANQQEPSQQAFAEFGSDSVRIVNQQKDGKQAFAELGITQARTNDPTRTADRVGRLRLVDSNGNIVCKMDENAIIQRVISKRLDIIDGLGRVRAIATTEPAPGAQMPNEEETIATQGVIWLNNERVISKLTAPANRRPVPSTTP